MRFRGNVGDGVIHAYCAEIDWLRTMILGYFADGVLRGVAELVQVGAQWPRTAEFALTVEVPFQNQGVGSHLLQKALVMARNRFISSVCMLCVLENNKMRHVAQNCGVSLTLHNGELEGRILPPWPSYLSLAEEAVTESQALFEAAFDAPAKRTPEAA
jgi:GNAT superfamily N-acetyltransferase